MLYQSSANRRRSAGASHPRRSVFAIGWLLLSVLLISLPLRAGEWPRSPAMPQRGQLVRARCTWVIDGDTAWFAQPGVEAFSVRLIGIDAPELAHGQSPEQPWAAQARETLQRYVQHKTVWLERGAQAADRYGRALCYVWLEDGSLLNLLLLEQGQARLMVFPGQEKYAPFFEAAWQRARGARLGLWQQTAITH